MRKPRPRSGFVGLRILVALRASGLSWPPLATAWLLGVTGFFPPSDGTHWGPSPLRALPHHSFAPWSHKCGTLSSEQIRVVAVQVWFLLDREEAHDVVVV